MGLMSTKIGRDELTRGDHIYTWRSGYSYSHHGIYVEDGKVIHLTRGPGFLISSSSESQASNDRVECCNIHDFLCDGQLYRFEYSVGEILFLIKRAGTCSRVSSIPPEQVLHNASYLLEHGFGNYNLLNKNCEDFALYCKTSIVKVNGTWGQIKLSEQITSLRATFVALTFVPHQFLPVTLFGVVVCVFYCFIRLSNDVGSQTSEFAVVAVEKLDLSSDERNVRENMNMMEKNTRRWFLSSSFYIVYTMLAIKYWYWTPETKFLAWLRSLILHHVLSLFVSDHLTLRGFKLGQYSASTIWVLGYWYWRWRSVSTILLWTRSICLLTTLLSFISDRSTHLKLVTNASYASSILELWYWTPESKILIWFKTWFLYSILSGVVSDHLRLHGFKRGEYSAYTIWLLGHLYWRWTSVSTIHLWTRSLFLYHFVQRFVSDAPRQLKLPNYVAHTTLLFNLWYWTPRIIILQWIKLALVYKFLFHFISNLRRNHGLVRWEAFFVCFVIQSLALFLGLDYSDYVFRFTKITFV